MIGTLYPRNNEDIEVSNISCTKTENLNTTNSTAELFGMPPDSNFQHEQNNLKQSIIVKYSQIIQ